MKVRDLPGAIRGLFMEVALVLALGAVGIGLAFVIILLT